MNLLKRKALVFLLSLLLTLVYAGENISLKISFQTSKGQEITGVYQIGESEGQSLYIISDIKGNVFLYGINYASQLVSKLQSIKAGKSVSYLRVLNGRYYALTPVESKILEITYNNKQISVTKSISIPSTPICFHFISSKHIVAATDGNYYLFNELIPKFYQEQKISTPKI